MAAQQAAQRAAPRAPSASPLALTLLLLALAPRAAAIGDCDAGDTCAFSFAVPSAPGGAFTLALRGLCKAEGDYSLDDGLGHVYYAQICGSAREPCLPKGWQNEYEYGRVVQKWGPPPACNSSGTGAECVEESTGLPVCCTSDCQVRRQSGRGCRSRRPRAAGDGRSRRPQAAAVALTAAAAVPAAIARPLPNLPSAARNARPHRSWPCRSRSRR